MSSSALAVPIGAARVGATLPARAGLGLKPGHFREILENAPDLGFWEIHAENYMVEGGPFHYYLTKIRERYPLSIHGVGLSIGSELAPDSLHLDRLKTLLARYEPASFSEHLAWTAHAGVFFNDLLPIPYDARTLTRVCAHIGQIQDHLGRRMLIENPATYLGFESSSIAEAQFISEVVARSGCGLLLDVNNVYVSARNLGFSAEAYIDAFPADAVMEIHLAGHTPDPLLGQALLVDSHDAPVAPAVWALYERLIARIGPRPTLIERDEQLPPFAELLAERWQAHALLRAAETACV